MDHFKFALDITRNHRVFQHLIFWIIIVLTSIPAYLIEGEDSLSVILLMNMCIHVPQVLSAYFLGYYLIPNLFLKKKYVYSILIFLVATYFFAVMGRFLTIHVGEELVRMKPFRQESLEEIMTDLSKLFIHYLPIIYTASFQFLFVKYFMNFIRSSERQVLFEKDKAETELKALKAQLNPHFLFNTLNNIYSLSLDNSPKAPAAIGKLSEILDHILYKCNERLVPLSAEITLLNNYIALEKLRYDERLEITFIENIETDFQLPPLLLLSLVENAFKHGAGEDSGSPKINISIAAKKGKLDFEISNTVAKGYEKSNKDSIGLTNIRKQLDLVYGIDYILEMHWANQIFTVNLQIKVPNL